MNANFDSVGSICYQTRDTRQRPFPKLGPPQLHSLQLGDSVLNGRLWCNLTVMVSVGLCKDRTS